jgi:four helix bundle protein
MGALNTQRAISKRFQDPIVWRKPHEAVIELYRLTSAFPKNEIFSLTQQMRRAAVLIPANIGIGVANGVGIRSRHTIAIAIPIPS